MKQRRALVTGATGFVGSHLVRHLLAEGWAVHVIVRPGSSLGQLTPSLSGMVMHRFDGNNIELMRGIGARVNLMLCFISHHFFFPSINLRIFKDLSKVTCFSALN
ncbi:MAG: GDP-mannose 4,6-dehydratase [Comamonadaceae bacterium]|nr:GDP-mannose 4,6-dehydratase [Comamonadaceae bacterium]